ncbi:hypothetical protein [Lentibacillus saliphilus]|uniref:hypothetical protein n=1 Tax=Lentibacillus saliphilus TaxID=2737028 RepID=UPI001C2FE04D|nr:hypothetical protein [Lentibacillus saliphilus]
MKNILYVFYVAILAVISVITQEVVTFIMLGFILLSLNNIHNVLKRLLDAQTNTQRKDHT